MLVEYPVEYRAKVPPGAVIRNATLSWKKCTFLPPKFLMTFFKVISTNFPSFHCIFHCQHFWRPFFKLFTINFNFFMSFIVNLWILSFLPPPLEECRPLSKCRPWWVAPTALPRYTIGNIYTNSIHRRPHLAYPQNKWLSIKIMYLCKQLCILYGCMYGVYRFKLCQSECFAVAKANKFRKIWTYNEFHATPKSLNPRHFMGMCLYVSEYENNINK